MAKRAFGFACLALCACSLVTSWSDLPLGEGPDSGAGDVDAQDVVAPPLVDAGHDAADASHDAAVEASVDAGGCGSGRLYCGGDGVLGDPSTLYKCSSGSAGAAVVLCEKGCAHKEPAHDDACVCVAGGFYCGNDQVVGDPAKLYKCNSDYTATLVQTCPTSCIVRPGQDDICK